MAQTFWKSDIPTRFDTKKAQQAEKVAIEREVYAAVTARERGCCRICGKRADPNATGVLYRAHHHHIVYRSAGGGTTTSNVALVCPTHHSDIHSQKIRIEGNADERLSVWRKDADGVWFMVREEVRPGQWMRD